MPAKTTAPVPKDMGPNHWVMNYADYLYSFALTRIDDNELAKDLVQETFLAALEGWKKFDRRSSEKTWLTSILKNKIFDAYRKKSNNLQKHSAIADGADIDEFFEESGHWKNDRYPQSFGIENVSFGKEDIASDIEDRSLENKEFHDILTSCMNKLPVLWKNVFTMKHIDGESSENICSRLELTAANFWVISHRAKLSLRACLEKNWI